MILVKVENVNGTLVTTSNRVADELNVRHDNIIVKINKYLSKFNSPKLLGEFYIPSTYTTKDGRTVKNYLITEKGIAQLIGGYSSAVEKAFELNVAYINKFEEMKNKLNTITERERLLIGLFSDDPNVVTYSHKKLVELETKPLNDKLEIQAPKVEYHDKVLNINSLITTTKIAKDLSMSARKLNEELHSRGIIYKHTNTWLFYSEYQHMIPEYADYHITEYGQQLKWTEKGRQWIIKLLNKEEMM